MTVRDALTLRVLGALLREDVLGLRSRSVSVARTDGRWLRLEVDGRVALLPVTPDGFQCEDTVRRPLLDVDGTVLTSLDEMIGVLRTLAAPEDRAGYDAFGEECRQTLATMRLHAEAQGAVLARLAAHYGPDPADWTGLRRSLALDTLAAYLDHPVYPTARGRSGLGAEQLRRYAPEFHPAFGLRWLAVPSRAVEWHGPTPPGWWPTPERLGLRGLTGWRTIPVHPLSVGDPLDEALRATGLAGRAVLAELPYLEVLPTLSMRTVAVVADPVHHLKLPLATATLGQRNRRTIKPGVLPDAAAGQRLLNAVIAREPRFADTVLPTDEQCYAETGHELLAVLLRRYPPGLRSAVTVPIAALLASAPTGRLVIDRLADRFYGGEILALYDALLTLLLDWQTTLFGYGIALESHQQNTSLVLDRRHGRTRLRLLYKDNDGPRINTTRIKRLDVDPAEFADPRIRCEDDRALTDLFTTITGHLCTAALAFGLAAHHRAPLTGMLQLLRDRLTTAVDRLGAVGDPLRVALLEADRLPVKAMVTAGTLLSKERSGATDINKYYTSGPNYLRRPGIRR